MENSRDVSVGDLIYGSDAYYGQVTRVGGSVVEFTTVGLMPAGPKGDQGDQGPVGPQGPQGIQGEPGEVQLKDMPGVNLAMPDLTGKTDLGDGEYLLVSYATAQPFTLTYNVYSGIYTFNGLPANVGSYKLGDLPFNLGETITMSFHYVSGTSDDSGRPFFNIGSVNANNVRHINPIFTHIIGSDDNRFNTFFGNNISFNNYKAKIKFEKGSTATLYTVPGQIPQYATKEQEAWITPTLLNGWENRGDSYATLQYMKDSLGFVHIKGSVRTGSAQTVIVLPVGYRPSEHRRYMAVVDISEWIFVNMLSNGSLNIPMINQPGKVAYFNITYKAEA